MTFKELKEFLDNTLGKEKWEVPIVRLFTQDEVEAILTELQLEIHELENPYPHDNDNLLPLAQHNAFYDAKSTIEDLVDEKINSLKAESEVKE